MDSLPLVTLVTPSYNQGRFLEAALRSVLEQDYPRVEYLVYDGGSNDQSQAILQRYADRLAYWETAPDRGQAHAINKGLARSRGELLGWLNSDDVLAPGALRRAVEALQANPQVDVVYGRLVRIDEQGRRLPTPVLPKDRLTYGLERVIGECIVNQPGALWRRGVMERVGLLDERLRYNLDYEYWMRIAVNGGRFLRLDDTLALFRLSRESKTVGQAAEMALEQLDTLERLLAQPDLPERLGLAPEQVRRQARYARAVIGLHACYGFLKQRRWRAAAGWLGYAAARDPALLFDRRWRDLLQAGIKRRLERPKPGS
ncbi:MAG: glycosyltransferase family 2 protein [Chloroflexota bacterium]